MNTHRPGDRLIGAVIPAAGSSSRYGQPKLLLPYRGKTLIGNTVDCLTQAGVTPIAVVSGDYDDEIRQIVPDNIDVVHNPRWQQGMGISIATGVREIQARYPQVSAVLVALPDQPLLTVSHIRSMIRELGTAAPDVEAVATRYGVVNGVPALFSSSALKRLTELDRDQGARALLQGDVMRVRSITPDFDLLDIDTEADYQRLLGGYDTSR